MDQAYTVAHVNKQDELVKELTRYETELTKKLGSHIVLVAYTKNTTP